MQKDDRAVSSSGVTPTLASTLLIEVRSQMCYDFEIDTLQMAQCQKASMVLCSRIAAISPGRSSMLPWYCAMGSAHVSAGKELEGGGAAEVIPAAKGLRENSCLRLGTSTAQAG